MKAFILTASCFLLIRYAAAQEFKLINYYDSPTNYQSIFFYKSLPDNKVNASLRTEYRLLSDFFMVTADCIYYDTSRVSNNYNMVIPDSLSNPVFLNLKSVNSPNGVVDATTIDQLVHQFGMIVIKKYKLEIPIESKIVLTDYLAGYYMACRNRALENKVILNIINPNGWREFNIVSNQIRQSAYRQGEGDYNNNYLKRKVFPLADLLRSGLAYAANSFE